MSDLVVALMFGIGSGGWIFSKVSHSTGNNYKTSVTTAVLSGAILTFVLYTLMKTFFGS